MIYPDPNKIPRHTKEAIDRYVENGLEPGGFCLAVLCNDLVGAVARADQENMENLIHVVAYCANAIPAECWGSGGRCRNWLEAGGLNGARLQRYSVSSELCDADNEQVEST